MKYGIRDSMLRLPFEQTFAEAKRIGFDGVEICIGGNYSEHKLWSGEGIAEIQQLSADADIEVPSLSPGGFTSYTFAHPDESNREEGKEMLKYLIETCPKIGADAILVPFFGNGKINPEDITSPIFIGGIKEVALLFDGDNPGRTAIISAGGDLLNAGLKVAALVVPEDFNPHRLGFKKLKRIIKQL